MNELLTKVGGRRFLLAVGCGFVTSLLCWFAKIDATTYRDVILGTVGAYILGNVWQKRNDNRAEVEKAQIAAQEQPS